MKTVLNVAISLLCYSGISLWIMRLHQNADYNLCMWMLVFLSATLLGESIFGTFIRYNQDEIKKLKERLGELENEH